MHGWRAKVEPDIMVFGRTAGSFVLESGGRLMQYACRGAEHVEA